MCDKSVGELGGWWAKVFKTVMVLILGAVPTAAVWAVNMHIRLARLEDRAATDRFSAQMYVDAQDMLEAKNPQAGIVWLAAREIKELQQRYFPQH